MNESVAKRAEIGERVGEMIMRNASATEFADYVDAAVAEAKENLAGAVKERDAKIRELTFADETGHSHKMSVAEWITYWRKQAIEARREERERLSIIARDMIQSGGDDLAWRVYSALRRPPASAPEGSND